MSATSRRSLFAATTAVVMGSGITAGIAASVADLVPADPDAELLSLRAELDAAVGEAGFWNTATNCPDEDLARSGLRLSDACWAIVDMPPARTPAGWALKAAASMHQFRFSYGCGGWGSDGEEMAWNVLRELARDAYQGVAVPDYARSVVPS